MGLPLCYSHSADALASVDESEGRGDKDFSGLFWSPKRRRCHGRRQEVFNLAAKGVAVTTWYYGFDLGLCVVHVYDVSYLYTALDLYIITYTHL